MLNYRRSASFFNRVLQQDVRSVITGAIWRPLFQREAAKPYQEAVSAIIDAIDAAETEDTDWGSPLLHAYLARSESSPERLARAKELVDRAVESMGKDMPRPALYGGFAGIGWLSAHTDALFERTDDAEAYEEIDDALLRMCALTAPLFVYDLISGVVGIGVYFLERLPHPRAVDGLTRIVEALARHAEWTDGCVTWHTPSALLPDRQRALAPAGYYNLGLAHGVPGIISLLGEMWRARVRPPGTEAQVRGAIGWVLSQRLTDGSFPSWVARGAPLERSRVAWCYGELGIALSVLVAARALGDRAIEKEALEIARGASMRRDTSRTFDAGLCHGAAGNAHLFNRLFQCTGAPEFRDAAMFWFNQSLAMQVEGAGIAGYRSYRPGWLPGNPWHDDTTFLTGASGVALAYLAAVSRIEPAWDRVLLSGLEPVHTCTLAGRDGM